MEIRYATISKTGRRHNNEDAFKVIDMPESNRFMGIVCDGMGGHSFGETASETVFHVKMEPKRKDLGKLECNQWKNMDHKFDFPLQISYKTVKTCYKRKSGFREFGSVFYLFLQR